MIRSVFPRMAILATLLVLFLGSCASAPESAAEPDIETVNSVADPAADMGPDSSTPAQPELAPNIQEDGFGFLRYDRKFPEETRGFSPSGIAFSLNQLFVHTGLSGWMSDDQWEALADHIFQDFPAEGEAEGIFREIGIPQFFLDGGPLVLQLGMLKPGAEARIPADSVLVIQTNIYIDRLAGQINAEQGRMVSLDENIALVLLRMEDGNLVSIHNIDDGRFTPDSLEMDANTGILLAAATDWVFDERDDNLEAVGPVLDELRGREGLNAHTRSMIELTDFRYSLRRGDAVAAELAIERIMADEQMFGDEDVEAVILNEAWPMLRLYRRLAARD